MRSGAYIGNFLENLFRYEVFKMLKAEGKINDTVIENMINHVDYGKKSVPMIKCRH